MKIQNYTSFKTKMAFNYVKIFVYQNNLTHKTQLQLK